MSKLFDIQRVAETGRCSLRQTGDTVGKQASRINALYTPEQKRRRDESVWTLVQGILAPFQFVVFLASLYLVMRHLMVGTGYEIATYSIVFKTLILYTIMITGAIWEKVVFGKYLFVEAFFWEDVFSMLVLALHTAYLIALYFNLLAPYELMVLALAAYAAYVVNAVQFILKLRAARLQDSNQKSALSEKMDKPTASAVQNSPQPGTVNLAKSINPNLEAST
jgi:3-vinyl bacteriochlorophyllide hydratase